MRISSARTVRITIDPLPWFATVEGFRLAVTAGLRPAMSGVPSAVAHAVAHEQVHAEAATDSEKRQERRERHADREQRTEDDCSGAEDLCPAWERENDPEGRSAGAPLASARDTVWGRRRRIGMPVAGGRDGMCLLATLDGHGRVISFVLRSRLRACV